MYAYCHVFFTGTFGYALINETTDYATLVGELSAVMTIHGALMVLAGLGFGFDVLRARVLPAWTAIAVLAESFWWHLRRARTMYSG